MTHFIRPMGYGCCIAAAVLWCEAGSSHPNSIAAFIPAPYIPHFAHNRSSGWTPSQREVAQVENALRGHLLTNEPLESHIRMYAGIYKDGQRMIQGSIVTKIPSPVIEPGARGVHVVTAAEWNPGIYIVPYNKLYGVLDYASGTCPVQFVLYSVSKRNIVEIGC